MYFSYSPKAMDEAAVRGLALFKGKVRCLLCDHGPHFTDDKLHTLGGPQVGPQEEDLGRYDVMKAEREKGVFKTPRFRSVSGTALSMHDGAFKTLEEVIEFLAQGGGPNSHLSPLMTPWGLTPDENTDLLAFFKALTGETIPLD